MLPIDLRITRRSFVVTGAAAIVAPRVFASSDEAQRIPLWPGLPPGGGGPEGTVSIDRKGAISHIASPGLEVFLPKRPTGAAVLVAGGGGYKRIEMRSEAYPAAAWLQENGVAAFVLSYRLPIEGWSEGPSAPLQDAQRALRLIRFHAERFGLDVNRIGALGFSAGGHLLGLASARSADSSYSAVDGADALSAASNASALIYPVITLKPPYDKTSTRKSLVGGDPSPTASAEWSVETHVRSGCPPMFLAQAEDDPISNPANTLIMASACEAAGVPVEMHRFASGGHGFGMGKPGMPTTAWPEFYRAWLEKEKFIA